MVAYDCITKDFLNHRDTGDYVRCTILNKISELFSVQTNDLAKKKNPQIKQIPCSSWLIPAERKYFWVRLGKIFSFIFYF